MFGRGAGMTTSLIEAGVEIAWVSRCVGEPRAGEMFDLSWYITLGTFVRRKSATHVVL